MARNDLPTLFVRAIVDQGHSPK